VNVSKRENEKETNGEKERERERERERGKERTCCIRIAISSESEGAIVIRPIFLASFFPALLVFVFNLAVQQACPAG